MNTPPQSLILGATGKTGRRIVDRLSGLRLPFRPGSRSGQPPFDWNRKETWPPALYGMDQIYLSFYPDLCIPGAIDKIRSFCSVAVVSGVKRIVLLSGRGEPHAELAEQAVITSGADWTILRCSFFSQNFSENFLLDSIRTGHLSLPVGAVAEPFVDVEDIADVAVAALTRPGHSGRCYELTGPVALTFADAVQTIAGTIGRPVRFQSVSPDFYRRALGNARVPEPYVNMILYLFATLFDGRNQAPAGGVQRALGRPPRSFEQFVQLTAATRVWATE